MAVATSRLSAGVHCGWTNVCHATVLRRPSFVKRQAQGSPSTQPITFDTFELAPEAEPVPCSVPFQRLRTRRVLRLGASSGGEAQGGTRPNPLSCSPIKDRVRWFVSTMCKTIALACDKNASVEKVRERWRHTSHAPFARIRGRNRTVLRRPFPVVVCAKCSSSAVPFQLKCLFQLKCSMAQISVSL